MYVNNVHINKNLLNKVEMASKVHDKPTHNSNSSDEDVCLSTLKRKKKIQNIKTVKKSKTKKNKHNKDKPSPDIDKQTEEEHITVKFEPIQDSECDEDIAETVHIGIKSQQNTNLQETLNLPVDKQQTPACAFNTTDVAPTKPSRMRYKNKVYPCRECHVEFFTYPELKTHLTTHQGEHRLKCRTCNKRFARSSELNAHRRTHTTGKSYACDVYSRSFTHNNDMLRHKQIHTEERLWVCQLCQASFESSKDLERHVARHEGSNPYSCTVCDEKFPTKEYLDDHTFAVGHALGSVLCRYCSLVCVSRDERRAHVLDQHPAKDDSEPSDPESEAELQSGDVSENPIKTEESEIIETDFLENMIKEQLSINLQCTIVNKMYNGRLVLDICKQFNLTESVVNQIWSRRDVIMQYNQSNPKLDSEMFKLIDEQLFYWYSEKRENGDHITGKMLTDMADEIAVRSGFLSFNASNKWLDRFKKRHNIALRLVPLRRDPCIGRFGVKWKESFFSELWPKLRCGYSDEDIFAADELGVFFNPSDSRVLSKSGKKYIHGDAKDRFALFMCTNLTGSEKRKMIVCGTEDPLQGSIRLEDTLPVDYVRNRNGHITSSIFEDLIRKWDEQLELESRTALLILDRASIHTKLSPANLKLVFVPWKAQNILMPIKNGIASSFRNEFRKLILLDKASNVLRGVDRNLTSLEGLEMVSKAWDRVKPELIQESFTTTGFEAINQYRKSDAIVESPRITNEDQTIICNRLVDYDVPEYFTDVGRLDMYIPVEEEMVIDHGAQCSAFGGNRRARENSYPERDVENNFLPIGTDRPENVVKEKEITRERAMQDLEIVRRYLETSDTSYEVFCSFAEMEKILLQMPIDDMK